VASFLHLQSHRFFAMAFLFFTFTSINSTSQRQITVNFFHNNEQDDDNDYRDLYNPNQFDRQKRHRKQQKPNHKPKKSQQEVLEDIAETRDLEGGFKISYQPALFEEGWLQGALKPFFDLTFITDVTARVKGGKEASVYRCVAHESVDVPILAAKVYRPRMFRNLRKDHQYREGREIIGEDGKSIKGNDMRVMRAVNKGSSFGQQLRHTSWLSYEYSTLKTLYELGADVPKVYSIGENAILMTFCGDELQTAPTLSSVSLDHDEAHSLFDQVMHNVELMLKHHVVHGDLSAFNILYWQGDITLIDFPQAVDPLVNRNARTIFQRDVERVCEYFQKYGVRSDGRKLAKQLWRKYYDDSAPIDYHLTSE
jgi:RIO kinase 1